MEAPANKLYFFLILKTLFLSFFLLLLLCVGLYLSCAPVRETALFFVYSLDFIDSKQCLKLHFLSVFPFTAASEFEYKHKIRNE